MINDEFKPISDTCPRVVWGAVPEWTKPVMETEPLGWVTIADSYKWDLVCARTHCKHTRAGRKQHARLERYLLRLKHGKTRRKPYAGPWSASREAWLMQSCMAFPLMEEVQDLFTEFANAQMREICRAYQAYDTPDIGKPEGG